MYFSRHIRSTKLSAKTDLLARFRGGLAKAKSVFAPRELAPAYA